MKKVLGVILYLLIIPLIILIFFGLEDLFIDIKAKSNLPFNVLVSGGLFICLLVYGFLLFYGGTKLINKKWTQRSLMLKLKHLTAILSLVLGVAFFILCMLFAYSLVSRGNLPEEVYWVFSLCLLLCVFNFYVGFRWMRRKKETVSIEDIGK